MAKTTIQAARKLVTYQVLCLFVCFVLFLGGEGGGGSTFAVHLLKSGSSQYMEC